MAGNEEHEGTGGATAGMLAHMKSAEKEENAINDALPTIRPQSELHIQMTLQDDTTFEDLRQKIEMYEQVSQRWMSDGGLQMNVKPLMDVEDRGGPMEVDAIWSKGGKKGLATMEIFDLTQDDSAEELETENDDENLAMAILAVREVENENEEETFYECQSEVEFEPPGTSSLESTGDHDLRHDPRAQYSDEEAMKVRVCMVRQEAPTIALTLDSGADVSVAPEEYYAMGMPGTSRSVSMMDAQGGAIKSSGNRRLRLQAYTRDGELIEFVEQFALGVGVSHPLLSFGRLLKQGWVLSRDQDGLYVEHPERKMKIPARLERNSLVMDVQVCAVRADDMDDEPLTVENEASKNDDVPKENAVTANDMAKPVDEEAENVEKSATGSIEGAHHPDQAGGERGVKRAVDAEDGAPLALMEELSEQKPHAAEDRAIEEAPTKKSKTAEMEAEELRSPGYTTEESGDVVVEASSSEDGKVKSRMARWANWKLRCGEVKSEPMELSDSPVVDVEVDENHVFPVREEGQSRQGYISRELALLEKVPGWHALPNGIVVHSSPQATHFLDPSMSFGDEWCARLTLLKKKDNSGLWEQIESLAVYRDTPLPFRAIPGGPRPALTFVAPGLIRDYFVWNSEVPVSQYPLLQGEPSSWPDDERDEEGGEFPMLAAGLPWQYSVQGILMKTKFAARQRVADMAEEATGDEQVEKEAKTVGEQAMKGEPAGNFPPGAHELSPKRQRIEDVVGNLAPVTPPLLGKREYALPWDDEDDEKRRMSPKRRVRSIQEEFPGGDDMVAEEALQQQLNAVSDEEEEIDAVKGKPPVVSDDELARLDAEACKHEEARLEAMGVLERMKDGEEEELKKNTAKMAKAMGANAKVALVIALSLLQGGKGAEVQESENEDQDDESWWMRPLITMLCLAMIGALSLARLVIDGARAWWNGRRINEETIEEKQDESDRGQAVTPHVRNEDESGTLQPEEPWQAEDQEKVNMQWQIIQLEVAVAEQEEKMTEIRRDRDIQSREVVRMYDMCTNLRFELEKVKEERDNMMMKLTGSKDTDDEHAVEMARVAEDCARAWEAVELWKKRSKEILTQANEVVKEKLESTRFTALTVQGFFIVGYKSGLQPESLLPNCFWKGIIRGFVMYSHDGKRVELKGNAESGKRSGSSSASQSDGSIKEENQKLKDAIRRMLQAEKPEDADLDAVRTLIKVDPREEIRQRQRQLNQERRILNRAENLKETLHKKENSYQSWKHNMQEGLAQEDRRLSKELAELQAEIKAAEEKELNDAEMDGEPSDVDPTLVDVTRQVVQDELKEMKDQMGQFASYAAQMERQNQHLTEQDPVNHAEVKHLLTGVSEEAQRYFLQNMQNEPEKFPTMRAAAGTGTSMPSEMRASAVSPVPGGLPAGRRPDAPKGTKAKERFPSSVNRVSL
ncbi:unnamed protein product [Durusdinium trenchii]|uniref:Peptidase A2 domain-containing protein n=1 Tax=Durusdinium trenchii TaxID=1381693 RepID=A0ABP0KVA8_9DINO